MKNFWQEFKWYIIIDLTGLIIFFYVLMFGLSLPSFADTYAIYEYGSNCSENYSIDTGLTLTNNFTAWTICKANLAKSSGKWYYETKATTLTSGNLFTGITNADQSLGGVASCSNGNIWYGQTGDICPSGSFGSFTTNDVVGIAVDLDNNTVDFYKNCSHQFQENITADGPFYPMTNLHDENDVTVNNFGASTFDCTVPEGYNAGWYTSVAPTPTSTPSVLNADITDWWNGNKYDFLNIGSSLLLLAFYVMLVKVKNGLFPPEKKRL